MKTGGVEGRKVLPLPGNTRPPASGRPVRTRVRQLGAGTIRPSRTGPDAAVIGRLRLEVGAG
ncbi:hypothetical protein GCM10018987_17160 [Streptomyces cremeus]